MRTYPARPGEPCPSCSEGKAKMECDGCGEAVCDSCWAEHNEEDDPGPISKEQFILLLGIGADYPLDPREVPAAWRNN